MDNLGFVLYTQTSFEADAQSIKKVAPYSGISDGNYSSSNTPPPSSAGSTAAINKAEADVDPWDIVEEEDTQTKWSGKCEEAMKDFSFIRCRSNCIETY